MAFPSLCHELASGSARRTSCPDSSGQCSTPLRIKPSNPGRSYLLPTAASAAIFCRSPQRWRPSLQSHFPWMALSCNQPRVFGFSASALPQKPTAVAANPAMGYPPRVRPGRKFPMAWYPYVGVAVPAMIARNPNVVSAGARYPCLDNWCGRSDSDNYFCVDRSGAQKQPEGRADQ